MESKGNYDNVLVLCKLSLSLSSLLLLLVGVWNVENNYV